MVFHQGDLSSEWSFIRVVFHQGGLSSGWSVIRVVFISVIYHQGLSSEWSFIRVIYHQSGLSSGWSVIRVVFHQGDLSSEWSFIRVVYHQSGLSSGWSVITQVFHQGGLSSDLVFFILVMSTTVIRVLCHKQQQQQTNSTFIQTHIARHACMHTWKETLTLRRVAMTTATWRRTHMYTQHQFPNTFMIIFCRNMKRTAPTLTRTSPQREHSSHHQTRSFWRPWTSTSSNDSLSPLLRQLPHDHVLLLLPPLSMPPLPHPFWCHHQVLLLLLFFMFANTVLAFSIAFILSLFFVCKIVGTWCIVFFLTKMCFLHYYVYAVMFAIFWFVVWCEISWMLFVLALNSDV